MSGWYFLKYSPLISIILKADFEDATAPTWDNLLHGQLNLIKTNDKTLQFTEKNKEYKFKSNELPTLIVRPRGWHLPEKHVLVDGEPMSGSLFDFGVYFFHNVELRRKQGLGGVFYYLPKLETYHVKKKTSKTKLLINKKNSKN